MRAFFSLHGYVVTADGCYHFTPFSGPIVQSISFPTKLPIINPFLFLSCEMGANHTTLASIHATSTTSAAATTLGGAGVTGGSGDESGSNGAELPLAQEIIDAADPQLSATYAIDRYLVPGSGRMMRTYRLKHKKNGSAVVAKVMWVVMATDSNSDDSNNLSSNNHPANARNANDSSSKQKLKSVPVDEDRLLIQAQQQELSRIYGALRDRPHTAPFLFWKVGDAKNLPHRIVSNK